MLRSAVVALALAGAVACSDGTAPLGPGSGGGDAGIEAPRDAGSEAARDGGAPRVDGGAELECRFDEGIDFALVDFPRDALLFDGLVTVRSEDPLVLEAEPAPNGARRSWTFVANGRAWPAGWVPLGERVRASIAVEVPFWFEATAVLMEPESLRPFLVVWTGDLKIAERGDVALTYTSQDCTFDDTCGPARAERLVVRYRGTEEVVAAGSRVVRDDYVIGNGRSAAYVREPQCEDAPSEWHVGFFARPYESPVVDCGALARDACIAESECVLWGSETDDPGYVCVGAATSCEFIVEPDACAAAAGCGWDPGTCYCPEDMDCLCGGGPAPKCRTICGGRSGDRCAASQYCDFSLTSAPACAAVPDGPGVCERVPEDCDGTPNATQCACTVRLMPRTFDDDCSRRRARASGPVMGACP